MLLERVLNNMGGMVPISLGYESDTLEELLLANTKGDCLKQQILDRIKKHSINLRSGVIADDYFG
jgi:hypothetical protein